MYSTVLFPLLALVLDLAEGEGKGRRRCSVLCSGNHKQTCLPVNGNGYR